MQDGRYPGSGRALEVLDLPEAQTCCGFGGVFSVEHPGLSGAMLARKIANLRSTAAPVAVVCDAGCLTHINGGLRRQGRLQKQSNPPQRVVHIADVLASR